MTNPKTDPVRVVVQQFHVHSRFVQPDRLKSQVLKLLVFGNLKIVAGKGKDADQEKEGKEPGHVQIILTQIKPRISDFCKRLSENP